MEPSTTPAKTSGYAIASLVSSLLCLPPLAIIFGHLGLSSIKKSAGQLGGFGLALAGTIIGYSSLLIALFFIVPVVFVGARAWEKGSERAECLIMQRNIDAAILSFQESKGLKPGDPLDFQQVKEAAGNQSLSTTCPSGGVLKISETVPSDGESAVTCPHADDLQHGLQAE